ncbi:putative NRPS-like protein biosynthetic cluster [Steccherinum ochraceum]|uniref:Putative NRPS-like protein biosynthetic cluster n=1 Tax=Steccherinum ochraceum TaxID=92696 RepID=A0A4R0RDM7_9APHY|nr:putative NRPS-like protein biosynthetic cluster [Steccherinum ochraceum]
MSSKRLQPPLDGSVRVIPGFVDFNAEHNPGSPCFGFPSRVDPNAETYISQAEYAQASHRAARILRPERRGDDGEVVAVLINADALVYGALINGMARADLIPFPMSPRNSAEAVFSMLEKTSCHRIISQPLLSGVMNSLVALCQSKEYPLQVENLPSLDDLFPTLGQPSPTKLYPPSNRSKTAQDILMYLHSSGSTGFPKPIPQTQEVLLQWTVNEFTQDLAHPGIRYFSGLLPSFHTLGVLAQLLAVGISTEPVILFTPKDPEPPVMPNPQNVLEVIRTMQCSGVVAVPAFVEAWANSEEAMQFVASLKRLHYSGGPLSAKNAKHLTDAGVVLGSAYGSTEGGPIMWTADAAKYGTEWLQVLKGRKPRWIPQGDGSYELHILTCETHQPAVENLPDAKGYATSDLFEPHPTVDGLWRIVGRTDDVIVLGTGEKVVPLPQEGLLASTPMVAGVVMFGRERNQPGVLIEPAAPYGIPPGDVAALVKFRDAIWHSVEEANKLAPSFARIFKEMIIVTDPSKPMPRAGKGTVQRKQTLKVYAKEVDQLYETVEQSVGDNGIPPPETWTLEIVEKWLFEHAQAIMTDGGNKLSPSVDLFDTGFDSLSATYLRNRIIGALRSAKDPEVRAAAQHVPQELIFNNPTLVKLAAAVINLIHPDSSSSVPKSQQEASLMEEMIAKYSLNFPAFKQWKADRDAPVVVLLTGSTGNLGSHVLESLLLDERVTRVFTLNRHSSRKDRQRDAFIDGKFSLELLKSKKLSPLIGDTSLPDLGLDAETLSEIKNTVTHVAHVAWRLDFNLSLSSFESLIASTRNLIDFSAGSTNAIKFLYTSSITAAQNWDDSKGPVPEQVLPNAEVAVGAGYGSSKYVVERVLALAARRGLQTTTFRIGQVTGSLSSGAWNTSDWVPIIVKSSQVLGSLPSQDDDAAWITMNTAARAMIDIIFSVTGQPDPLLVNLVHPRPIKWSTVFQSIGDALSKPLPLVPFTEWLAKVESLSENANAQTLDRIPAIKLLSFLRDIGASGRRMHVFATAAARRVSPSLDNADSLNAAIARSWVAYWKEKQFIA